MILFPHAILTTAALLLFLGGCEAAPRARPVKGGPVDTGSASVEAARRQLQGTWELTSLQIFPKAGTPHDVPATGRLQYDEYGNLTMRGTVTGNDAVDSSVLNISGRVAIDPGKHTIMFQNIQGATPDDTRVDPQLAAKNVRYYEIEGDQLKTTTKDASGAVTAMATWKRVG
ncbi:MAG TPA: hypothetical protein VL484_00825 [Vicinamibacterales bacterium]|jgi:hypothetical protein|nr:hypothetical protein [Vicinamibacterales bacterium]